MVNISSTSCDKRKTKKNQRPSLSRKSQKKAVSGDWKGLGVRVGEHSEGHGIGRIG